MLAYHVQLECSATLNDAFTQLQISFLLVTVATVSFEFPSYTFAEDIGTAQVCLIKDAQTAGPITIDDITTSEGTATGRSRLVHVYLHGLP